MKYCVYVCNVLQYSYYVFVKNHSLMDFKEKEKNIYMFYRAKLTLNFALALV